MKDEKPFDEVFFAKNAGLLPTVRIAKIELNGFKSVEHGEVVLNCGKQNQLTSYETQSDILGIYGQNGSGKTSLIEALKLLDNIMAGVSLSPLTCSDLISVKTGVSNLSFTFILQHKNGEKKIVEYSFSMKKERLSDEEIENKTLQGMDNDRSEIRRAMTEDLRFGYRIIVFDETIKMAQIKNGGKTRLENIITTADKNNPFGPKKRLQEVLKGFKELGLVFEYIKENSTRESKSFIFNHDTLNMLYKSRFNNTPYFETIMALKFFAKHRLRVIGTHGMGRSYLLPLYTKEEIIPFSLIRARELSAESFNRYNKVFENMSLVLKQLVPGLTIKLKKNSETERDGVLYYSIEPIAYRGNNEMPLRNESDGVLKIISILSLIIAAYNDESFTIAIDEFDAGIFEYLLGEILQSFEESGKGQFIFTSHNLRPLEVIDKKFIVFTTTNPKNRYYRFKDVATTNNLRDKYFREIILGEQDEELYSRTKRFEIESALMDAYENGSEK